MGDPDEDHGAQDVQVALMDTLSFPDLGGEHPFLFFVDSTRLGVNFLRAADSVVWNTKNKNRCIKPKTNRVRLFSLLRWTLF